LLIELSCYGYGRAAWQGQARVRTGPACYYLQLTSCRHVREDEEPSPFATFEELTAADAVCARPSNVKLRIRRVVFMITPEVK